MYDSWWAMPEDPHNTELGRFQAEVTSPRLLKDNANSTTAAMKIVLFKIIFALHSNIWSTISDIKYDCRHFCIYTIFLMEIFHEIYCHFDNAKLFTI